MSDQLYLHDQPEEHANPPPHVLKWRRNGDAFEGLVTHETEHPEHGVGATWVRALPVPQMDLGFAPDLSEPAPAEPVDEEESRTRSAITLMYEQYGQYHEVLDETDIARVEVIGRIGREVAESLGKAVGTSAVRQKDGLIRVCFWLTDDPYDD